jgi:hypothetical protein
LFIATFGLYFTSIAFMLLPIVQVTRTSSGQLVFSTKHATRLKAYCNRGQRILSD